MWIGNVTFKLKVTWSYAYSPFQSWRKGKISWKEKSFFDNQKKVLKQFSIYCLINKKFKKVNNTKAPKAIEAKRRVVMKYFILKLDVIFPSLCSFIPLLYVKVLSNICVIYYKILKFIKWHQWVINHCRQVSKPWFKKIV